MQLELGLYYNKLKSRRYGRLKLINSANLGLTDHCSSTSQPARHFNYIVQDKIVSIPRLFL